MLWAACLLGFFRFLRAGGFTVKSATEFDPAASLVLDDVSVDRHDNPSLVKVRLKSSKTDPFRHGIDICLGHTHRDLCPVSALLAYVVVRPALAGPLFVFRDGSFLTRERLVIAVQSALRQSGSRINVSQYTGHSFRIGAAMCAAQIGIQDSTIKMLGRWESAAYQQYIQTLRETLAAISAVLAQAA